MITPKQMLDIMRRAGAEAAQTLQTDAPGMSGTELNRRAGDIPTFTAACKIKNMLNRPIGFVCQSSAGRVVKLIQPYDSSIYPGEPETLDAHWGFQWSTNPDHALPFVALATSPYMMADCCTFDGKVWISQTDNNVFSPSEYPAGWEEVEI